MRYGALVGVSVALVLTASMAGAETITISMKDRFFSPWRIVVKAGATVQWVNDDTELHQVISGRTTYDRDLGRPLNSGMMMWNTTYAHVFANPGSYWYLCVIHSALDDGSGALGMVGEVVVVP